MLLDGMPLSGTGPLMIDSLILSIYLRPCYQPIWVHRTESQHMITHSFKFEEIRQGKHPATVAAGSYHHGQAHSRQLVSILT